MLAHWEARESGFQNIWETKVLLLEAPLRLAKQWAQASTHALMEDCSNLRCHGAGFGLR